MLTKYGGGGGSHPYIFGVFVGLRHFPFLKLFRQRSEQIQSALLVVRFSLLLFLVHKPLKFFHRRKAHKVNGPDMDQVHILFTSRSPNPCRSQVFHYEGKSLVRSSIFFKKNLGKRFRFFQGFRLCTCYRNQGERDSGLHFST